jgi:SAM-dependent methyltransferase
LTNGTWWATVRATLRQRTLPPRYDRERALDLFPSQVRASLHPGIRILDAGAGRTPTIPVAERPAGCQYVGLDISAPELQAAPAGSYQRMVVGDIKQEVPELRDQFDLVVSYQVLEHVKPLEAAFANFHRYLRPGGRVVAQMSGAFSAFGVINRLVPQRLGIWALEHLVGRPRESVFPAFYHRCSYGQLARILQPWGQWEIIPRFDGAGYFRFSRVFQAAYIAYEEWALRRNHRNLATHYLVVAIK